MAARLWFPLSVAILAVTATSAAPPPSNAITGVRFWSLADATRVVVETKADFEFRSDRVGNPDRLFFDLLDCGVGLGRRGLHTVPVGNAHLRQIRLAETQPGVSRIVFDLGDNIQYTASRLSNPSRLVVELRLAGTAPAPPVISESSGRRVFQLADALRPSSLARPMLWGPGPALPWSATRYATPIVPIGYTVPLPPAPRQTRVVAAAKPVAAPPVRTATRPAASAKPRTTSAGTQSMTRVLGLKVGRIVLDPGHGGHDTGTIGPKGLLEKELVLDVCKRLGILIESRLNAEVVFTRTDDTFIPLERRTEIANEHRADLFLSVHANSSPVVTSSGVETFYLNFTSDRAALEVAARENASSQKTVHELRDLVQKITMQDKIEESRQFAAKIQQSVYSTSLKANSRTRDRGVKKAPFVVLIGASMPSVLAEIGFISNPRDEALFNKPDFRQKIAEGLFRGISQYANSLGNFQVAARN